MQLCVARHTERLQQVVGFYRDGIGLTEIGGFRDHGGYNGVLLAVPGTGAHLELTAGGGHGAPAPHPKSLLVLYLSDDETVQTVVARLGVDPVPPANPYWAVHGLTLEDPEGGLLPLPLPGRVRHRSRLRPPSVGLPARGRPAAADRRLAGPADRPRPP